MPAGGAVERAGNGVPGSKPKLLPELLPRIRVAGLG